MSSMGMALMGTGTASGENRAVEARPAGDFLAAFGGQHHPGRAGHFCSITGDPT